MTSRIKSNVTSTRIRNSLKATSSKLENQSGKLASGSRITKSSDDAAGLAIATVMKARLKGKRQALRNSNDAVSIVQIAEGSLEVISSMVNRMRELAMRSASDTVSNAERDMINTESRALRDEIQRISTGTKWNNDKVLLDGSEHELDIQVGTNGNRKGKVTLETFDLAQTIHALGIYDVSMDTKFHANTALYKLDYAISEIGKSRAKLGSYQSRFQSTINNLETSHLSLSASHSQIKDADYAKETGDNVKTKIQHEATTKILAAHNFDKKNILKLL